MRSVLLASFLFSFCVIRAQVPDMLYSSSIATVKLFTNGNPLAYPALRLGSGDKVQLDFDDLDARIKNYSYTYQLCNADWTPADIGQFDFIRGFSQNRLSNYKVSSVALTKYVHYQAILPEANSVPTRSGNYLLKVFLDGDTSKLAFTKRLLIYEDLAKIPILVQQPFNGQLFNTHQKLNFKVLTGSLNVVNAMQQFKVVILQNNRWDNAVKNIRPTFIRQSELEYNAEQDCVFPAGKEWRWLDLRSFRLQSDRVAKANYGTTFTDIIVKPDRERSSARSVYFKDNNGMFFNEVTESVNPYWQADYASTHFSFIPAGNVPILGRDVYLIGELTNYGLDPKAKMIFNDSTNAYTTTLFLKQGYYDYMYVTVPTGVYAQPSFEGTEGNNWETENSYTVLVYYRAIGGRADQLVGMSTINSLASRSGGAFN